MKRFISKVVLLLVVLTLTIAGSACFCCFVSGNQYETGYMGALADKIDRLESISEPKIILVGHSNLAFGICSDMIEKEFNMPVVNLGLHGGLGNSFHEEMAKQNINEGDIVVLCHSSYADDGIISDTKLAWTGLEWNVDIWDLIDDNNKSRMAASFPYYLLQNLRLYISGNGNGSNSAPYSRNSFNEYGDVVLKPESKKKETNELFYDGCGVSVPPINDICIDRINELNSYIIEQGATLLVAGYPIASGEYTPAVEEYDAFEEQLRNRLNCEVISHFKDYFIPYEYFYDTVLHLTEEGAKIRSNQLISDLKTWMNKG